MSILGALLVWTPAAVGKQPKTDKVSTNDGATYIGAIQGLQSGALTLDTDPAGTVNIDWWRITKIETETDFRVETDGGTVHYGRLGPGQKEGELQIVGSDPDAAPVVVRFEEVVLLSPAGQHFRQRLNGSLDLGFSYTNANQAFQYTLGFDANYLSRHRMATLSGQSIFSGQEDADHTSQHNLSALGTQRLFRRWSAFVVAQIQSNAAQGYDLRTVAGGGIGRFLVERNPDLVELFLGAVYDREDPVDSSVPDQSAEALLGLRWMRLRTASHTPSVTIDLAAFSALGGESRYRLQGSLSFRWSLVHNLSYSLSVQDDYDSAPPSADALENSLSVVSSLGYTF